MQRLVKRAKYPERYLQAGISPKLTGLLIGPPGCGKTMLADAAAHEVGDIYLSAKVSDIESMWAGEAEKNIAGLFDLLKVLGEKHNVVLLIDELEGLAASRGGMHMMTWERKMTSEFLTALNDYYPNCLILGATNDAVNVDAAVIRSGRFNEVMEVSPPGTEGRAEIITKWVKYFTNRAEVPVFNGIDVSELVAVSDGLTGADLKVAIEGVIADAVDDGIDNGEETQPVDTKMLVKAFASLKRKNDLRQRSYI
ncbi:MAG TPA: ATP-binding protein [Candidatus Saccharimonadales bacterium]|nr:ATP-binding protein [Candidatus Saccharimonadales bacterium]